jgi:hypothetical protein
MLQTLEREPQDSYHGMPHHPMTHGGPHGNIFLNSIIDKLTIQFICRRKSCNKSNARNNLHACAWFKGLYRKR